MRALAAAAIVALHVWIFSTPDGDRFTLGAPGRRVLPRLALGLNLLFVLSAFLLYRPFASAVMRRQPTPSLLGYLVNRGARDPSRVLGDPALRKLLQTTYVRRADSGLAIAPLDDQAFLLNALFLQSFYPSTLLTGIGPVWALTTVVTFYVLLPVLVLIATWSATLARGRRGRRVAALVPAAILFVDRHEGGPRACAAVPRQRRLGSGLGQRPRAELLRAWRLLRAGSRSRCPSCRLGGRAPAVATSLARRRGRRDAAHWRADGEVDAGRTFSQARRATTPTTRS